MARIAGVDIPRHKPVVIALTHIYGIGRTTSAEIVRQADVNPQARVSDLTEAELGRVRALIGRERVEGDLRRVVQTSIARLREIGSYRGLRHRIGLPTRGQRTRTNARTRKGPRRTVGIRKRVIKRG
ncbi:MAG: 30S ribosomal protein S13 [Chloroflexi bacterium]|nr:30S ribosomal protein S13 [Rhodospirillaceae bacterium]MDE2766890.1 30S ribosomal protein S13 [Chloroflexota bacterium]MDE2867399.1 30S ribosomal protein S13 [Chloroflexota bacterium]MDE2918533.1 30S ribosomal protein S13 [Chloroflexota bacterium]MYD93040.1 30S ribosomal protein S13 [Chloroflexota bacterium]